MRHKMRMEGAMRRGFLSIARARVHDRAANGASWFDTGVPVNLKASVRVRASSHGDGEVELMTTRDVGRASAASAIPWSGGMPSPAMRDAREAFVDALSGAVDVARAQRRLDAGVSRMVREARA